MRTILTIGAVIGSIYLLLLAFYAVMQRNLVYYPTTVSIEQARQMAEALDGAPWLNSAGHWQGWKIETGATLTEGNRRRTMARALVFHGNAGMALNRSYYADLLSGFERSGPWEVYVFEYPGYGPRKGTSSEAEFADAAVDAMDELLALNPDPMLIIGESIGSGVASELVRRRPDAASALLLITPFDSMVNVARHHMPFMPVGLLLRDRYNNHEALSDFHKPLIIVTAGKDTIVPAALAEPLLKQHSGPALHKVQTSADHNSLHFNPEQLPWPVIDEFLATERE